MADSQLWASTLLSSMLIRHLESRYPEAVGRLNYQTMMTSATEGVREIADLRSFLLDPNNWIPYAVLRELMRNCEEVSGAKDFSYRAALTYYEAARASAPTLLETIAVLLNDVASVLRSVSDWASAYTNYLQLQAFARPGESQTLYILSRFTPAVDPHFGNAQFVRGHIEGISKLDPQVDTILCEEQYSQVRLSSLVGEFGGAYEVTAKAGRAVITCRPTGKVVVVAKSTALPPERVPMPDLPSSSSSPASADDRLVIAPDPAGAIIVLLPYGEATAGAPGPVDTADAVTAWRIERGGTLKSGPLSVTIPEGAVYDCPYTRYRVRWRKRAEVSLHAESAGRDDGSRDTQLFAHLLFQHLKDLQTTQRRTLSVIMHNVSLAAENVQLREELTVQQETGGILGKSQAIQALLSLIRTVAASDATVLIMGDTGTGKELAARLIHQMSHRRGHRFVAVNCGALPETLLESELFGHERGAFTGAVSQRKGKFELAEGGTLFLDEIGDVSPAVQVKLLRVLQEKEFQRVGGSADIKADVRVLAATNRDLEALIEQKQFRRDLFYRLNVIQLDVPPLRERTEDIPILVDHYVRRFAERAGRSIQGLTPEALQLCLAYRWPGNIRELENAMERAVTLAPAGLRHIGPEQLPPSLRLATVQTPSADLTELVNRVDWPALLQTLQKTGSLSGLLDRLEWAITQRAVVEYGGNKSRAAKILGRTYRWLRKRETEMTDQE